MSKLNFEDMAKMLNRAEMKKIMAGCGSDDCQSGSMTCEQFYSRTGCYPSINDQSCQGRDGCTYSFAKSQGSC
jgi:hypothetical protein